jgi:hypothetical protein
MLECILLQLTPTSLYHARTVCEYWCAVVEASPILFKRLWPDSSTPIIPSLEINQMRQPFELNNILQGLNLFTPRTPVTDECHRLHYFAEVTLPPRYLTKTAYWREMQLTEPPIKKLFLRSNWLEKYISCETGITAGQVADLLEFREGRLYYFH